MKHNLGYWENTALEKISVIIMPFIKPIPKVSLPWQWSDTLWTDWSRDLETKSWRPLQLKVTLDLDSSKIFYKVGSDYMSLYV